MRRSASPHHLGVVLSAVASEALGESAISSAASSFPATGSQSSSRGGAARYASAALRFSFGGDGIKHSTCMSTIRGAFCNSIVFSIM